MHWMFVRRAIQMTALTLRVCELYSSQLDPTEGVTA